MANVATRSALAVLLWITACLPSFERPEGDPERPITLADLGVSGSPPWSEVTGDAPPGSAGSSASTTTTGTTTTGAVVETAASTSAADEPGSLRDLRITEVLVDPEGKDGGAASPEIVEIVNTGADAIPLASLVILARSWPKLDAGALGLADEALAPGEILLLRRFADEGEAGTIGVLRDGEIVSVSFITSSGLRNLDGAVMLRSAGGTIIDAVIYGGPAPSPYDAPEAWIGEPLSTPGPGLSLCRIDPQIDSDGADDWIACAPSPGLVGEDGPIEGDTTTTDTTTSGEPEDAASLVIVEVLSNAPGPGSDEKFSEYVEILNLGPGDADLTGFTIADDLDPEAPGRDPLLYREGDGGCITALCLAAGRRALIVGNLYAGPTGAALILETDDTTIADGGLSAAEAVVLRDADELVRSTYRAWEAPLSEPYPVAVESPLHRLAVDAADEPASWIYGDPSPGLP